MTDTLVTYSVLAVYSAMAVYTLAFLLFTLDLARRSAAAQAATPAVASAAQVGSAGATAVLERTDAPPKTPRYLRAATALTVIAWALHVAGTVMRGLAAGRVPWANMYEFTLTATAIIVGVFLAVQFWQDLRFLGVFITGFALIALGVATVNFYVAVVPLPPALQSVWLVIHVFVASLGTGFFALGAGLSVVQLMKERRLAGKAQRLKFLDTLPAPEKLENTAYRLIRRRLRALDLHSHRWCDLGRPGVGSLLGLGHQGGLDLHHLDDLRRLHSRTGDPRLARLAQRLARDNRIQCGALQLHGRQPVLQGTSRVQRTVGRRSATAVGSRP